MTADWIAMVDWTELVGTFLIACQWLAFALLVFLLLNPSKFEKVDRTLSREYGIRKRMVRWLEEGKVSFTPHSTSGKRGMAVVLMAVLLGNILYLGSAV